jgi:hypothetical protein
LSIEQFNGNLSFQNNIHNNTTEVIKGSNSASREDEVKYEPVVDPKKGYAPILEKIDDEPAKDNLGASKSEIPKTAAATNELGVSNRLTMAPEERFLVDQGFFRNTLPPMHDDSVQSTNFERVHG